ARRGDTKRKCDTELPRMERYFNCTLAKVCNDDERAAGLPDYCTSGMPLLVATDETDQDYRDGLLSVINASNPHVTPVDLDALVRSKIEEEILLGESYRHKMNNYAVYLIGGPRSSNGL
ncbi:MAG: hypothetical protein ACPH4E_06155, partial [Schleiferiaceae bacterium]